MKRFQLVTGALAICALGVTACTGDDNSGLPTEGDAGPDAAAPGVDASLPGPDGGTDSSTVDSSAIDASSDASDASDASTPSYGLFVGTDYTSAELSVVSLHPDSVVGRLPVTDQDSVPFASGGLGSVIEHTVGKVIVLDRAQPWIAHTTIDVNDTPDAAGHYAANPRTVLTTGTKAYVALYATNTVKIVDVAAGTVTGSLDLSMFLTADDPDGLVDVQDAAYDPATNRVYFLLQRINQFDYGPDPDNVGACLASHGAIVAVDATTDAIVDLNGASTTGSAITLLGDNPDSLTPDFAGGRIIVAESGCYQPVDAGADPDAAAVQPARLGRGVESVALLTGTPTWLYQTNELPRLAGLVWVDDTRAFVNEGSDWFTWNPTQPTLGSAVPGFPLAPFSDGTGRVVGLSPTVPAPDAAADAVVTWAVVALDATTLQVSTIATNPFQSVDPDPTIYGVASALLH